MSPFPRVEVTGYPVPRGAALDEVIVRAGRGASVSIDCRGRGCPYESRFYFMRAAGLRLVSLKQRYRSGAVIELRVTRPRRTGKFVRVTVRSPSKPLRFNACVKHGDPTPVAC